MEQSGVIREGEWISHSPGGMFTGDQEADLMMIQLLENYPMIPDMAIADGFWPGNEESTTMMNISSNNGSPNYSLETTRSHLNGSSQGLSQETDLFPTSTDRFYNLSGSPPMTLATRNVISNDDNYLSTDFCAAETIDTSLYIIQGEVDVKIDCNMHMEEPSRYQREEPAEAHENCNTSSKINTVKRPKMSENDQINKRRKSTKSSINEEGENHIEMSAVKSGNEAAALNLNGKTRATRGSATDAQSVYARRRRERINEKLKVLQNLVPNGRKVDISTMLEEAVNYVKFLQLQIKMLSSDDMWMYAPICYNGMVLDRTW